MNPYDAVLIDLISTTTGNGKLAKMIDQQKNGQQLKGVDRALVQLLITLKQNILNGSIEWEQVYYRAIALSVDTINLREIHKHDGEVGRDYPI